MVKTITNKEYETALKNIDNKLIMDKACMKFKYVIDSDELYRCKLVALWEALQHWKPGGRKFTSYLYQKVHWECIKIASKNKKGMCVPNITEYSEAECSDFDQLIEPLPKDLREIVKRRFVYNMTLREIGDLYGCCYETIRKRLNQAFEMLKEEKINIK